MWLARILFMIGLILSPKLYGMGQDLKIEFGDPNIGYLAPYTLCAWRKPVLGIYGADYVTFKLIATITSKHILSLVSKSYIDKIRAFFELAPDVPLETAIPNIQCMTMLWGMLPDESARPQDNVYNVVFHPFVRGFLLDFYKNDYTCVDGYDGQDYFNLSGGTLSLYEGRDETKVKKVIKGIDFQAGIFGGRGAIKSVAGEREANWKLGWDSLQPLDVQIHHHGAFSPPNGLFQIDPQQSVGFFLLVGAIKNKAHPAQNSLIVTANIMALDGAKEEILITWAQESQGKTPIVSLERLQETLRSSKFDFRVQSFVTNLLKVLPEPFVPPSPTEPPMPLEPVPTPIQMPQPQHNFDSSNKPYCARPFTTFWTGGSGSVVSLLCVREQVSLEALQDIVPSKVWSELGKLYGVGNTKAAVIKGLKNKNIQPQFEVVLWSNDGVMGLKDKPLKMSLKEWVSTYVNKDQTYTTGGLFGGIFDVTLSEQYLKEMADPELGKYGGAYRFLETQGVIFEQSKRGALLQPLILTRASSALLSSVLGKPSFDLRDDTIVFSVPPAFLNGRKAAAFWVVGAINPTTENKGNRYFKSGPEVLFALHVLPIDDIFRLMLSNLAKKVIKNPQATFSEKLCTIAEAIGNYATKSFKVEVADSYAGADFYEVIAASEALRTLAGGCVPQPIAQPSQASLTDFGPLLVQLSSNLQGLTNQLVNR